MTDCLIQANSSVVYFTVSDPTIKTLTFAFDSFINPPSTTKLTPIFISYYQNENNTLVETFPTASIDSIKPGKMDSAQPIISDIQEVGAFNANITVEFKTNYILPANGMIKLSFPPWSLS